MYTRYVFEVVKSSQSVSYTCIRCKKKRTKVVKTEHTINPFNKNADGVPKTRQEVRYDVNKKQAENVAEVKAGTKCNKCKDEIVAEKLLTKKANNAN